MTQEEQQYVPRELRTRIRALGVPYRDLARAVGRTSGGWFCDVLRGHTRVPHSLVQSLRIVAEHYEKHGVIGMVVVNKGGAFAGLPDEYEPPAPPSPTTHRAGSDGKVKVMAARAEAGYDIHHPLDERLPVQPDYRPERQGGFPCV